MADRAISRHICVDHCIILFLTSFYPYAFYTLFKDQLDRSKATCSFKYSISNGLPSCKQFINTLEKQKYKVTIVERHAMYTLYGSQSLIIILFLQVLVSLEKVFKVHSRSLMLTQHMSDRQTDRHIIQMYTCLHYVVMQHYCMTLTF